MMKSMQVFLERVYFVFKRPVRSARAFFVPSDKCAENKVIVSLVEKHCSDKKSKVLDIGCGYGRFLKLLKPYVDIEGVEINKHIVTHNRKKGFKCFNTEEIKDNNSKYDVILMAHIIEHMNPDKLLLFFDFYLKFLKPGGILIIATPLLNVDFYDDFDHIKPYTPHSIQQIFSKDIQIQFTSKYRLNIKKVWFRKRPVKLAYCNNRYIKMSTQYLFGFLFRITFGIIGVKKGWVGVYKSE